MWEGTVNFINGDDWLDREDDYQIRENASAAWT
jgi:hypothetical protein